jgi:hypothetical protein
MEAATWRARLRRLRIAERVSPMNAQAVMSTRALWWDTLRYPAPLKAARQVAASVVSSMPSMSPCIPNWRSVRGTWQEQAPDAVHEARRIEIDQEAA